MSFAVKLHRPTSVRETISSTIALEAYLCKSKASTQSQCVSVTVPVTKESEDVTFIAAIYNSIYTKRPAWDDATACSIS